MGFHWTVPSVPWYSGIWQSAVGHIGSTGPSILPHGTVGWDRQYRWTTLSYRCDGIATPAPHCADAFVKVWSSRTARWMIKDFYNLLLTIKGGWLNWYKCWMGGESWHAIKKLFNPPFLILKVRHPAVTGIVGVVVVMNIQWISIGSHVDIN